MLDYAITLEFDKDTENKIRAMMDEVAAATGCTFMLDAGVPPHVTVSMVVSDDEERLISDIGDIAGGMQKHKISFANIGVFNPYVIYLGPVMNEFLLDTCRTVNDRLLKYNEAGNLSRYLPYQWVPHAAVAVGLQPGTINEAFSIILSKFTAFDATAEKIILARAEPYEELRSWELK